MSQDKMRLRDGTLYPDVAFGTGTSYKNRHRAVIDAILIGWDCGYRLIDTAMIYKNEEAVGEAIRILMQEKNVKREDILIQTKVHGHFVTYQEAADGMNESLRKLGVDYIDFVLHHSPGPYTHMNFLVKYIGQEAFDKLPRSPSEMKEGRLEVWRALEDFKKAGKVKHIGLSNYIRFHIEQLIKDPRCSELPEVNQIECHPYLFDNDIVSCCNENQILIQAYSPLGNGRNTKREFTNGKDGKFVLDDETLQEIAERNNCSVAQICISWLLTKKIAVVIKSESPKRLKENLEAAQFRISDADSKSIDRIQYVNRIFPDPYVVK